MITVLLKDGLYLISSAESHHIYYLPLGTYSGDWRDFIFSWIIYDNSNSFSKGFSKKQFQNCGYLLWLLFVENAIIKNLIGSLDHELW